MLFLFNDFFGRSWRNVPVALTTLVPLRLQ
jgi:hypothetical protein